MLEKLKLYLKNKVYIDKSNNIFGYEEANIRNSIIKIRGKNNKLIFKNKSDIQKVYLEIRGNNCSIEIGKNTKIGNDTYMVVKGERNSIEIGDNCLFSRNIKLMASDGHPIYFNEEKIQVDGSIKIGNNVWLADNVTIMKNVSILEGSIVGMNSTVTKSQEEKDILIVGNPGKIAKRNIRWEE